MVGSGFLLLCDFEQYFLRDVKDLPLQACPLRIAPETFQVVDQALSCVEPKTGEQAYQAWLGFYNSQKRLKWSKTELVQRANRYAEIIGLQYQPTLQKKTVGKMGLKGVPGLRLE